MIFIIKQFTNTMECDNFFDFNSLDNYIEFDKPLYSIISKRRTAKLIYLSPKQYIYKIAQGFGGLSYEDVVDSGAVVKSNINKYAEAMKGGDKFPIGYYTKDGESQEGRHRALAAMKLGCDKIPVIEFIKVSDKQLNSLVKKLKNKSFEEINLIFKKIGFKNGITKLGYNDLQRYIEYNENFNDNDEMLTESYKNRIKELAGIIIENEELKDLVYSNEKFLNNNEKFKKYFKGININDFKNYKFPKNDSEKIKEEIDKINKMKFDIDFIKKHDNIYICFKEFFEINNIDFPKILIKDLMEGSSYFLMKLKSYYNRPRPYQVARKIDIELKYVRLNSAKSAAFPSGHSAQSHLLCYVLSDLFPKFEKDFEKIAKNISKSRMMAKVHFPSDVEYGEKIAKILFKQYKKNNF